MKKKNDNISRRERSATVGLVLCFVAMIAVAGAVSFSQSKQRERLREQQRLAEAETERQNNTEEEETGDVQSANTNSVQAELDVPIEEETPSVVITPSAPRTELYFSDKDELLWPLDGNVLLNYSMDKTVYFSTLEQYKYNPALIISGKVGQEVVAAADGKITSIETTAQTGTTVTMSLGSKYELVCGQLKEVCVQEGDVVSKGDLIGYVSEPTKYYSVEGPNVYFKLMKDGVPVNPLEYLEE